MTRYGGTKALDAEMKIDLINNTILLDYSTVTGVARGNSNTGIVLSSEWECAPTLTQLKYVLWAMAIALIRVFVVFPLYCIYFTVLANYGVIKSADAHFDHQNLLKYVYTFVFGTVEKVTSGELKEPQLVVYTSNNLYFEYVLEGEYKEKIKSVSLVRHYGAWKRFGVFREVRQYGWNLIFEFSDPPKSGSCIVQCVG